MQIINKGLFLTLFLIVSICGAQQIEIITTTTQISSITKEIGQLNVNTTVLIPPGVCPGHYELRPKDISKLCQNGILLYHGWEGFIDDIKNAVSDSSAKIYCIDVPGSWLMPDVQIKAAKKIVQILSTFDPANKHMYLKNRDSYVRRMFLLDKMIKTFISSNHLSGMSVISSEMQKEFLEYLGFKVVDCFGRDEELTPGKLSQIINQVKTHDIRIIVSNLQSGTSIGQKLSEITKIPHVVLSNFPGGFENTETIEKTVIKNLDLLKKSAKPGK